MTTKTISPEVKWLHAKWKLPESAFALVEQLLRSESEGSTACTVTDSVSDWGKAITLDNSSADAPLVLIEQEGKAYLQSYLLYDTENEIAVRFQKLAKNQLPVVDVESKLKSLFPQSAENDPQMQATRLASMRQFTLITGGPGTGKTYTLARILALLLESNPGCRIQLAAPTGKAADRMKQSIQNSLSSLPKAFDAHYQTLNHIAETSSTLHTLLGYHPEIAQCRFNEENLLACEVLIVDECSMVDIHLWKALLRALSENTKLILLGDPNQLESVGQGNVFTELTYEAKRPDSAMHQSHVQLTESRRFRDRPGILEFTKALEDVDADRAIALLQCSVTDPQSVAGLIWLDPKGDFLTCANYPPPIIEALERVAVASTPEEALNELEKVCILTAQRNYFVGAKETGVRINAFLQEKNETRNQPIIINRNDPDTGLRNGNVGIIHSSEDGARSAYFPSDTNQAKTFSLSKLPDYSPAWAITIHRSQGSEYDHVLVILPREDSPISTRELLYTAITRARKTVYIVGIESDIKSAIIHRSHRVTLLSTAFQRAQKHLG